MTTVPTTNEQLADAIHRAAGAAFSKLFSDHPRERFYYCTLITTGEGHAPFVAAWSHEALDAAVQRGEERALIEWSYAESPYMCYGEEHFAEVDALFEQRPPIGSLDPEGWKREWIARLAAMENAMRRLDAEGLFGTGRDRLGVVIAVEVMPPDYSNTLRVMRLNPPEAIQRWLEEVAERPDDEDPWV